MPTVDREGSFRTVIYFDDHEPAHVHLVHSSGASAVFDLVGPSGVELRELRGHMKHGDIERALDLVERKRAVYLARWHEIHGGSDA